MWPYLKCTVRLCLRWAVIMTNILTCFFRHGCKNFLNFWISCSVHTKSLSFTTSSFALFPPQPLFSERLLTSVYGTSLFTFERTSFSAWCPRIACKKIEKMVSLIRDDVIQCHGLFFFCGYLWWLFSWLTGRNRFELPCHL